MGEHAPGTARMEAFSDGVIAVIITIMVLEIKVPHEDGIEGLVSLAAPLGIYLVSFAFTGIFWLNHQHLLERAESATHSMQVTNLGFLFGLSLLPLSTGNVVEKHVTGFSVALYAASLLLAAATFLLLRLSVKGHLERRKEYTEDDRKGLRNNLVGVAIYAAAIAGGFYFPRAALGVIGVMTLLWVLPNLSLTEARRLQR